MEIQVQKLRENAVLPSRATAGSAAYDLTAAIEDAITIEPGKTVAVPTGLAIELPDPGVAAFIYARSGLGIKHGIAPANCVGVIDSDYRGEILVGLHNHAKEPFTIHPGDRIAQMVLAPVLTAKLLWSEELGATERGDGGFGSTGMGQNR